MAFGDKKLYVCKKIGVENDEYGNEIPYFENAKEYHYSYMPTSSQVDYQIYGTNINNMFTMYVDMSMLGVFKSGDSAYLIDGETQDIDYLVAKDSDNKYKSNSNYRIKSVQPQNIKIKILFEKKQGGK